MKPDRLAYCVLLVALLLQACGAPDSTATTDDASNGNPHPDAAQEAATPDPDGLSDRTPDPIDGDAGCTCTQVVDAEIRPNGSLRETSLPCLCKMHSFFCPASPAAASAQLTGGRGGVVKTYDSCGLLEFRARIGSGFNDNRWIFDLATGTLVGNLWDGDLCDATCGCTTRAGVFPGTDCVVSSEETLCSKFGPQPCADAGSDGP